MPSFPSGIPPNRAAHHNKVLVQRGSLSVTEFWANGVASLSLRIQHPETAPSVLTRVEGEGRKIRNPKKLTAKYAKYAKGEGGKGGLKDET
jgi:hypothetical protein